MVDDHPSREATPREQERRRRIGLADNLKGVMRAFAGFDRIVTDPDILDGKPCVRGTRLSVERVLEILAEQPSHEDLQADYPQLTTEDIRQVLLFASRLAAEKIIPLDSSAA